MIEAEQERAETIIVDSMAIERAAEDVHELLEQACAKRGINTAGPTKELVTRLAESGASMRQLLEDDLAGARAELEAERARHEATRSELARLRDDVDRLERDHATHLEVAHECYLQSLRDQLAAKHRF